MINHPPAINVTQILVVNDVDCQNFSRSVGIVSPGIPAESQQTLSVVVLSFHAAVRQFDIPVSMFIENSQIYVNFSLPVHVGNVSIVFEVRGLWRLCRWWSE